MKKLFLLIILGLLNLASYGQKSDSTHTHYAFYRGLSSHETELKSKRGIKNGEYKVFSRRKIIARGAYKDDIRIGIWEFLDEKQNVEQKFNYSTKKIIFSAPDDRLTYHIDSIKNGDRIIYPVKIGAFTYGLNFLFRKYMFPYELRKIPGEYVLSFKFGINEQGKLVKFETELNSVHYNKVDLVDLKRLKPEDFEFTSARLNGVQIASQMIYKTKITID